MPKSPIKIKVKICRNFFSEALGLIGAKKPIAIFIKSRFGIHTFGLKFSIDVLILNKENKVVKLKENLKSCRIFIWNPKYNKVIELPKEDIKKNNIKVGDSIIVNS